MHSKKKQLIHSNSIFTCSCNGVSFAHQSYMYIKGETIKSIPFDRLMSSNDGNLKNLKNNQIKC